MTLLTLTVDIREKFGAIANANLDLGSIITSIITAAITLAALAIIIYFISGGYSWLTAGGDKAKVEEARNRITNAVIGLAIVAATYAIYSIVDSFFGIGLVTPTPNGMVDINCLNSPCSCGSGVCNGICRFPSGDNPSAGSCI